MSKGRIGEILSQRVLILDGATGTLLQERGLPAGVCPELWCLEHTAITQDIHRSYSEAGADVVFTCTFGANRFKLQQYGIQDAYGINSGLARAARQAVGESALVAGDMGPTGLFIEPFGELPFDEAVAAYREQVQGLLAGGVDLFVIETMIDIQETRAALIAVRELTDAFVIVTMTYEAGGRTLGGTDPLSALITLQSLGADAVGCNCSTGPAEMIPLLAHMKPHATVPLAAKPNAGLPRLEGGRTIFDMDASRFAAYAPEFVAQGANLLGGCCGTTPEHIRSLRQATLALSPIPPLRQSIPALSSPRQAVILSADAPLTIIGERINPTGKKALQQELLEGTLSGVRTLAREQVQQGACLLDVNVGMPGIDERHTSAEVVKLLARTVETPLVIDSSNPEVIEHALRLYPGRALINSISGEAGRLQGLLEIAARYGAMFILLPIEGRQVPARAAERQHIVEALFEKARAHGFTRDDLIVDALAMAVSADPGAARETLATIRWCAAEFGALSVLGLSNVSFGLPGRPWLNAAFVSMCIEAGLNLAIANPGSEELMNLALASDVLSARDREAAHFIARFSGAAPAGPAKAAPALTSPQRVYRAVLEGDREGIVAAIEQALAEGAEPQDLVSRQMIAAIREVGELYERKVYFLPQLIAGAEAMQRGFAHLEPLLAGGGAAKPRARILMATVEGDIHDIGKNIVALMLKNHGFEVIDLGKDVGTQALMTAIAEHRPDLVGLSALMTTTMVNMHQAVTTLRQQGCSCPFLVGGAVVTQAFAETIGAHYARDGVEAVRLAERLAG